MYCVMRASVPSLYNVYRRYDSRDMLCLSLFYTDTFLYVQIWRDTSIILIYLRTLCEPLF